MNEPKLICRLCVEICYGSKSLYDANGRTNEIYDIIHKYLHPTTVNLREATHLTALCSTCWHHLWDFHSFHGLVRKAQAVLKGGFGKMPRDLANLNQLETFVIKKEIPEEPQTGYADNRHPQDLNYVHHNSSFGFHDYDHDDDDDDQSLLQPSVQMLDRDRPDSNCSSDEADMSWDNYPNFANPTEEEEATTSTGKRQYLKINELLAKWMPTLNCSLCPESYTNISSLEAHFAESHPSEEFHIVCCSRKLTKRIQIKEHLLLHQDPETYKCKICTKVYGTRKSLRRHLVVVHPESQRIKFVCNICFKLMRTKTGLKVHYASIHNIEAPEDLNGEDDDDSGRRKPSARVAKKSVSRANTKTNKTTTKPAASKNGSNNSEFDNANFQSSEDFINADFILPDDAVENSDQFHERSTRKYPERTTRQSRSSTSTIVKPKLLSASTGENLLNFETDESPENSNLKPNFIEEGFIKSEPYEIPEEELSELLNIHQAKSSVKCEPDECPELYSNPESSDIPQPPSHREPEESEQPSEGLQDDPDYDYDMTQETDNRSEYPCKECGKVCYSRPAYNYHMWYNHRDHHKHVCPECGRTFKRTRDLNEHVASHQKRDLYACAFCPLTFRKLNTTSRHRMVEHPNESNKNFYYRIDEKTNYRMKRGRKPLKKSAQRKRR